MTDAKDRSLPAPTLVFHPDYDISFYGLEKLHPFDAKKYGKVWKALQKYRTIAETVSGPVEDADLLLVHTEAYLEQLQSLAYLARALELPWLSSLPNRFLGKRTIDRVATSVLRPMRLATQGTWQAARASLKTGHWAINLGGGYHHANRHRGHGFCLYADIAVAIEKLRQDSLLSADDRVLLIDLDAHQGDGLQRIYLEDDRIVFLDFFNAHIFPGDRRAAERIDYPVPLPSGCTGPAYLNGLRKCLAMVLEREKVALVFYIAGTDVYQGDPLGAMALSREDIVARDGLTVRAVLEADLPLVYVLGGGYTRDSAGIIAESLVALLA